MFLTWSLIQTPARYWQEQEQDEEKKHDNKGGEQTEVAVEQEIKHTRKAKKRRQTYDGTNEKKVASGVSNKE